MVTQHTIAQVKMVQKTKKQIADQFHTIFFGADSEITRFYSPKMEQGQEPVERLLAVAEMHHTDRLVTDKVGFWVVSSERVNVLGKLYLSLNEADGNTLVRTTQNGFKRGSSYAKYSAYLFMFLAEYYDFDFAVTCVLDNLSISHIGLNMLKAVSDVLRHNPGLPSDEELDRLPLAFLHKWEALRSAPKAVGSTRLRALGPTSHEIILVRHAVDRIVKQAQEIKYRRLKDRLFKEASLEINRDRQTLTTGLAKFGFEKQLIESLEHAEAEYRKADSNFDFKTCADHNRSFFEALLWETATKVAKIRNETLTAQRKFPVQVRDYLQKAGFFSERFHKLCEGFHHFASEQSTHQLASGQQEARVVRNLNIELGLLIVRRLESFR